MLSLKLSAPVIGAFSAGLLLVGLYGLSVEASPFLSTAGTAMDRLLSVESSPAVPLMSSKRALVVYDADCRALAVDAVLTGEPGDGDRANRACFERAKSLIAAAPGNARVWLTLAQFGANLPDQKDVVAKAIRLSHTYAPWQAALAYERITLIDTMADKPADLDAIIDADLKVLAAGAKSPQKLADMYVAADQARRDQIIAAVMTRSPGEQNKFLTLVRRTIQ